MLPYLFESSPKSSQSSETSPVSPAQVLQTTIDQFSTSLHFSDQSFSHFCRGWGQRRGDDVKLGNYLAANMNFFVNQSFAKIGY